MLAMGLARDKWPLSDSQPLQSSKATRNRIIQTNTVKNLSDYHPKADWDGWTKMRFLGSAITQTADDQRTRSINTTWEFLRNANSQNQKLGWCGEEQPSVGKEPSR